MKKRLSASIALILALTLLTEPIASASNFSTGALLNSDWTCINPTNSQMKSIAESKVAELKLAPSSVIRKGPNTIVNFTRLNLSKVSGSYSLISFSVFEKTKTYKRLNSKIKDIEGDQKISFSVQVPTARIGKIVFNVSIQEAKFKSAGAACIPTSVYNDLLPKNRPMTSEDDAQGVSEQLLISPVPEGRMNATFMLGKPQSRDIGETLFFKDDVKVSGIEFEVALFTWISPEYHFATEDQKHNLEKSYSRGQYKPISAKVNVSLWRDDLEILSGLPGTFDLRNGFTKINEFEIKTDIEVGKSVRVGFPRPITVTSGYYYLNLYFVVEDLNITTLRFTGRESGKNTMGGPNRDMPTNCNYTPSEDLYPKGQAYFSYQNNSWEQKTPEEKWNFQTPRSYTFKLHDYAKVQECIVVGNYNDILNTGDILLNVYGSKL